jgi:hypothetical protein
VKHVGYYLHTAKIIVCEDESTVQTVHSAGSIVCDTKFVPRIVCAASRISANLDRVVDSSDSSGKQSIIGGM